MKVEKNSIHEYPSLAAYVRLRRMEATHLSVRHASLSARLPEGTWGSIENGRLPRPSIQKLNAIARILEVRPWPLAILAGTKPVSPLNRIGGLIMDHLPPPEWWARRAGSFIAMARQEAGRTHDLAARCWTEQWPAIPALASEGAWKIMETQGVLPALPAAPPSTRQPIPTQNLAQASGAWWWAIMWAVIGDPERALYLLPGIGVVSGVAHPEIAEKCDESDAWRTLVQAYRSAHHRKPESFDDSVYYAVAREVATALQAHATDETAGQRLARISAVWDRLSSAQQAHVVAIAEDLSESGKSR